MKGFGDTVKEARRWLRHVQQRDSGDSEAGSEDKWRKNAANWFKALVKDDVRKNDIAEAEADLPLGKGKLLPWDSNTLRAPS